MHLRFILVLTVWFAGRTVHAQGNVEISPLKGEDSIKAVVAKMMSAMIRSDVRAYYSCFADSTATIETMIRDKRGLAQVRRESVTGNINAIMQQPAGTLLEQYDFASVKLDGTLAHAWVPYKFYVAGKIAYCGAHSIHFIRLMNTWKIFYMVETRSTSGCEEKKF